MEIGRRRRWKHAWFSEEDVEAIVTAASGQYVYAATVIRYVSEPRRSPVERLRAVLPSQSDTTSRANPFASLDSLYTLVLTKAREGYESIDDTHDFLLILHAYLITNGVGLNLVISRQDQLFELEDGTYDSILCDLRSLLSVQEDVFGNPQTKVYHKSFTDFLNTPERAGPLYIPPSRPIEYITRCCLLRIERYSVEEIGGGGTLSDEEYRLRYKALDLDLLDCAMLLCAAIHLQSPQAPGPTEIDNVAAWLIQFGTSGVERIHAWIMQPTIYYVEKPPWIYDPNPRFEFMEFMGKCIIGPLLFRRIEASGFPSLAKALKKYSDEWRAWGGRLTTGSDNFR